MNRLKLFLIAGVLTAVLVGYVGPVQAYIEQKAELSRQQTELAELIEKRDRLKKQNDALSRPEVLEARARELALIRPGERAYVIRGLPDDAAPRAERSDDSGILTWLTSRL